MALRNRKVEGGNAEPVALASIDGGIAFPVTFGSASPDRDAFGRLRISEIQTLFDSKQIVNYAAGANTENHLLFYDQATTGTGTTTTYSQNRASTTLAVSATTAGSRVRQTRQRFNYQPGKSLVFEQTFSKFTTATGQAKRVGYFDANNGIFLESLNGTVSIVIRSNVTGTPVDTKIAQANWNLDAFDGNGNSGITLDWDKSQILFADMEWLGVGGVRVGFVINNALYYAHQQNNANAIDGVYMSTPNLPLRWEIANDGTGAATELEVICASVAVEGGQQVTGVQRGPNPALVAAAATATSASIGTTYAVAAIRLNSNAIGAQVDIDNITMQMASNDSAIMSLHLNPTLGSAPTFIRQTQSAVDYAIIEDNGIALTDPGYVLWSGIITTDIDYASWKPETVIRLGSNIAGTADVICLCCSPITAGCEPRALITWREQL